MDIEGCVSIVDLISRLCNCIAPYKDYVCKLKQNLNALRTTITELSELKNDVKRKVTIAEEQLQLKRLDQVQGWLSRVEALEAEVDKLITDGSEEIEKKCPGLGCCPKNCKSRYKLGKKVTKKLEEVTILKRKGSFEAVAEKQLLASAVERPSGPTVGLESAFEEVQRYIRDEQVGIIGIYGMGGVGKTTLLTQINNNLCTNFDLVIWIVVSKNSKLPKVQDDIAKKNGFHDDIWNSKSQEEKAIDIFGVLKTKRFVLLLDDIWEHIDLLKLGVPIPDKQNKSKVVFTTRSEDVCGRMEAQKKFKVKCLAPDKAWGLFQKKVGEATLNFHPEIRELAKNVAIECKGLPLALITIGRAMACKTTPQEWHHAGQVLKKFAAEFSGMGDEVFPLLKFSYDNLQSDRDRSCFLYCSLFPENYLISKEKLIEYWIGEGFLDRFNDVNEGYGIIGTLVRACLLEEDSDDSVQNYNIIPDMSGSVKMHDVIRDMALWIACKCGKVEDNFLVQARSNLRNAPVIEKWKGVERMALMHNEIKELTETPLCPNLLTLFLNDNYLTIISSGFFQNMPSLRVLDLSWNCSLKELPMEISELVSLPYLNLSYTDIRKLPIEYKNLKELKYLNLEETKSLNIIPQGLLSSFKKMSVLKLHRHGSFLLSENSDSILCGRLETLVEEVEGLKELNHFSVSIRTASTLSLVLRSPKILNSTKLLSLIVMEGLIYQNMSFLESMSCLHQLLIENCNDLEDLKVERANEGLGNSEIIISNFLCFHSLRNVFVSNCPKLKEVTWLIFAPKLEILTIQACDGMEEIIRGEASAAEKGGYLNLFAKLKQLSLCSLAQLKSIYPNALPFPCLKFFTVMDCPNLKKFPLNSDSAKGCVVDILGNRKWWNELEWEDEATRNVFLPFFRPNPHESTVGV